VIFPLDILRCKLASYRGSLVENHTITKSRKLTLKRNFMGCIIYIMHTHLVNVLMDLVLYVSLYIPNGPCTDMGEIWRGWVDFFTPDFTPIGSTCRPYEAQHSESPPGERKYGSCAERVLLVRMIVSWKHKRILNLMWYFGMNVLNNTQGRIHLPHEQKKTCV